MKEKQMELLITSVTIVQHAVAQEPYFPYKENFHIPQFFFQLQLGIKIPTWEIFHRSVIFERPSMQKKLYFEWTDMDLNDLWEYVYGCMCMYKVSCPLLLAQTPILCGRLPTRPRT